MKEGKTLSGISYCIRANEDGLELELDVRLLERLYNALDRALMARFKPWLCREVVIVGSSVRFRLTRVEDFNEADMRTICYFLQAAGFGVEGKINIQAGLVIIDLI